MSIMNRCHVLVLAKHGLDPAEFDAAVNSMVEDEEVVSITQGLSYTELRISCPDATGLGWYVSFVRAVPARALRSRTGRLTGTARASSSRASRGQ